MILAFSFIIILILAVFYLLYRVDEIKREMKDIWKDIQELDDKGK